MTIIELQAIMNRAKKEADMEYKRELEKIRSEAKDLNKEVDWDECKGMDFDTFCEVFMRYNVSDAFKIFYSLYQHIELLNRIIFKER